jgi:hypothetical protein
LVSPDDHADNLGDAGRALLPAGRRRRHGGDTSGDRARQEP